ncbi:MAG TPA: hypothetical protein VFR37_23235 [Longimicrobium sp.]|nr:hypothetical protein [Longimicrobium sp.]
MRGWIRMTLLVVAMAAVSAACSRADGIAAPEAADVVRDEGGTTQSDSTGRWGGYIGSGG